MAGFLKKTPRWVFAAVPLGFVALVALMVLVGERTGGPTTNPYDDSEEAPLDTSQAPELDTDVVEDPDGNIEPFEPTPSGPEYEDNDTVLE